ncbi:MAG: zinc-dependent alcohol dehydrogenase family protein [Actinobacteria bacterium]|nr:zinc-dependent alcohol dehydrogenase family protein [Actinomycetota bacterium]
MRAVVYTEYGGAAAVESIDAPVAGRAGAVIRVEATGLCRSDWHGWMGHDPDITLPHVPGHEFAGVVDSVGGQVTRWRPGDRVTVPFVCACGECEACLAGDQQVCEHQTQPGFTHHGSFAEYVRIDHADVNLVRLPDSADFVAAAALGCRFATAFRAVRDHGRVAPGQWVAVHGCGGVGLSAIMIATALGAKVVAIDVSRGALDLARQFGAVAVVDAASTLDVGAAIINVTDGGAHVSIDAFGSEGSCAASIESLRRRGRHVQVGLLPEAVGRPAVPMARVIALELSLHGSHGMAAHDYGPMLDLVASGALRPELLVTRTLTLDDAPTALTTMASAQLVGTSVIRP